MIEFIPLEIPVKPYVLAYIRHHIQLPLKLDMKNRHTITEKLHDYIERGDPLIQHYIPTGYTSTLNVHLTFTQFKRRGAWLTQTNIKNFNNFCETLLKERYHHLMDEAWSVVPGFDCHLGRIRDILGITIEDWSDDSMKKDYYRYRIRNGRPTLKRGQFHKGRRPSAVDAPF